MQRLTFNNTILNCLRSIFFVGLWLLPVAGAVAQDDQAQSDEEVPHFMTMYDDPYDIRNLYLHFQPFFGEVGALNVVGGLGIEGNYYHKNLFNVWLAFRTSYGKRFDINRDAAYRNATNSNNFPLYMNVELGGTYHFRDEMKESTSKVLLYSKNLKGNDWAATLARDAVIPGKVRNVIGIRLGGIFHNSVVNVNNVLAAQGKELSYSDGTPVINENMYSNMNAFIIFAGASYSWIRNFAVEFSERWDPSGDDQILTPFFDLMFAPAITLADVQLPSETVSAASIDKMAFGFRGGVAGKFNRKLSWGYTAEMGLRPGLKKSGFYLMFKMSFPLWAKKLKVGAVVTEEESE